MDNTNVGVEQKSLEKLFEFLPVVLEILEQRKTELVTMKH